MDAIKQLKSAVILVILLTILTGFIYPSIVTLIAQLCFPWQANGSLIKDHDKMVGSQWIGQAFTDPAYFWGRPSATTPYPYNAEGSTGSNVSPSNPTFVKTVKSIIALLQHNDPKNMLPIPIDLVTASGSGLDPEISPIAAYYQVARIAKARHCPEVLVYSLVQRSIQRRTFNLLGESRVNVLQLNLALDNLLTHKEKPNG